MKRKPTPWKSNTKKNVKPSAFINCWGIPHAFYFTKSYKSDLTRFDPKQWFAVAHRCKYKVGAASEPGDRLNDQCALQATSNHCAARKSANAVTETELKRVGFFLLQRLQHTYNQCAPRIWKNHDKGIVHKEREDQKKRFEFIELATVEKTDSKLDDHDFNATVMTS